MVTYTRMIGELISFEALDNLQLEGFLCESPGAKTCIIHSVDMNDASLRPGRLAQKTLQLQIIKSLKTYQFTNHPRVSYHQDKYPHVWSLSESVNQRTPISVR